MPSSSSTSVPIPSKGGSVKPPLLNGPNILTRKSLVSHHHHVYICDFQLLYSAYIGFSRGDWRHRFTITNAESRLYGKAALENINDYHLVPLVDCKGNIEVSNVPSMGSLNTQYNVEGMYKVARDIQAVKKNGLNLGSLGFKGNSGTSKHTTILKVKGGDPFFNTY